MSAIDWMVSQPKIAGKPKLPPGLTTKGKPRKPRFIEGRKPGTGTVDKELFDAFDAWPVGEVFTRDKFAIAGKASPSYARWIIMRLIAAGAVSKPARVGRAKQYTKLFAQVPACVLNPAGEAPCLSA